MAVRQTLNNKRGFLKSSGGGDTHEQFNHQYRAFGSNKHRRLSGNTGSHTQQRRSADHHYGRLRLDIDDNADIPSGSYYGVDGNANNKIEGVEKTQLSQGTTGLVIGVTSIPGEVTAPDTFYSATGTWIFTIAPTGSTEAGLDMSGWNWPWNGSPSIPNGTGAWQPANCADFGCAGYTFTDGIGRLQWDGIYGHAYTLDYTSTIPNDSLTGWAGVKFYTHLEGVVVGVAAIPEPTPALLFVAALPILFGFAKRRKTLSTSVSV
ncbi:MAG: PEP-CTERM sorting domain-containing protein [Hylemonella sp.]|nr:PEP-CTERM sorting domain-containing protein [Hylemonella sp.]